MTPTETVAGWQLDEAGANAYEEDLVPRFFDPLAIDLVATLGLQPGQHVLDVACGTGAVARHAARRLGTRGQVTAVDVSPAMLSVARRVAAADDDDAPIVFEQADAARLPVPDSSVNALACQQGLQFFADRPAALAEMRRVLVPGGRLAVSTCRDLEHQPAYRALTDVLTRHVGVAAAQVTASPYTLGMPDELEGLVDDAGFHDVTVTTRTHEIRFESPDAFLLAETSSSPLGALVDRLDRDVRVGLVTDLTSALTPYSDGDGGISFPFQTLTATATR